jgi:prepilin-type N-terminal cleavage/methylation domain-containing protein
MNIKIKSKLKKTCLPMKRACQPMRQACPPMRRGFSLVELLVVVAIITVMAGVLFAGRKNSSQPKNDVDTAARQLIAMIRQQQNNALSGQKVDIGGTMTSVCGLGVSWTGTTTTASAQAYYIQNDGWKADHSTDADGGSTPDRCVSNASSTASNPVANGTPYGQNFTFKRVTISPSSGSPYVFFKLPFAGISSSMAFDPTKGVKIVLTSQNDPDVKHSICVYKSTVSDMPNEGNCPDV